MAGTERGKLKIYIGYAAGVGKTYKMLEDAQILRLQGVDVVVGYFEPHGRKDTIAKIEGLEIVPRARIRYRGSDFEEMDTDAVLARNPELCLVDEFAHTNVPGSSRVKRWEDVEVLRAAGIDVMTTMNVQHLESLNDQIWQISGIRVRETVPDWVVRQADEVVITDLSPRSLLHRLERGVVYEKEKVEQALQHFFKESTLVALRELALRETAHEIEHRPGREESGEIFEKVRRRRNKHHRILILATEDPQTAMVIRRAKRISDFLDAECFAVTVQPSADLSHLRDSEREAVERHLNFARNLRIETRVLEGDDPAQTLVDFARRNQITQIFLARPREQNRNSRGAARLLQRIVRLAYDMEIVIVSEREPATD